MTAHTHLGSFIILSRKHSLLCPSKILKLEYPEAKHGVQPGELAWSKKGRRNERGRERREEEEGGKGGRERREKKEREEEEERREGKEGENHLA